MNQNTNALVAYAKSTAKALVAGLAAGVSAGALAASDDVVSVGEWWAIAAAATTALAAVWAVPNTPTGSGRG